MVKTKASPKRKTMAKTRKSTKVKLQKKWTMKRYAMWAFVIVFALLGTYLLFFADADTNYALYRYPLTAQSASTFSPKLLTQHSLIEQGTVTGYEYLNWTTSTTGADFIHFHDTATGSTSEVILPNLSGYNQVVWANDNTLWVIGSPNGVTGIQVSHYSFNSSPLPTRATLVRSDTFGNSDSRSDDIIQLASGAIVATYHQQGQTTSYQTTILYMAAGGQTWQSTQTTALYTSASKTRLVQHPADKSIWLFTDPDAWGAIEVVHLTETGPGLQLDWTNDKFIHTTYDGIYGPDPEDPDIEVAPDPTTGDIVLVYESAQRQLLGNGNNVYGSGFVNESYPVVARIKPDKTKTFVTLPIYVERISQLGLVVRPGEVWLAYRPVDPNTLAFDQAYVSLYRNGLWETPTYLGHLVDNASYPGMSYASILSGLTRPAFATQLADSTPYGQVNFLSMLNAGTVDATPPTIAITSPANGSTISGSTNVTASGTDNLAVTKVELYLNNSLLNSVNAGSLSYSLDTTKYGNGTYALMAKSYDAAGNSTVSPTISVQISNVSTPPPPPADTQPPAATLTSPLSGSTVKGTVSVSGSASDNVGVVRTDLLIDGVKVASSSSSKISYSWNTKSLKRGSHTVTLNAYDAAGNVGTAKSVVTK